MQANISLVIHLSNKLFADPRRIRLLLAIEETGSISRGARLAEISYKTAWDAIDAMNNHCRTGCRGKRRWRCPPHGLWPTDAPVISVTGTDPAESI